MLMANTAFTNLLSVSFIMWMFLLHVLVMTETVRKTVTITVTFSVSVPRMAGEISKAMARSMLIPPHLIAAHDRGEIKIHDLDYFLNPSYNCELVNLDDMLQNGTVINKKKIKKPKSLRTAMTLATQIIAQVASSTYGGQTISLAHLAEFVYISECKIRKKYETSPIDMYLLRLVNKNLSPIS